MKVITNTELVESRAKWGKRVAPVTLLFLVGGLVTNFLSINNPEYFRITLLFLFIGFVSAIFSSNLVNNWVREPRSDQVLEQLLKKFGNDYLLFNYTAPAHHVLLAPDAVHVITVKKHDGDITINERKVKRKFQFKRLIRFFGDEGLGVPVTEAESNAAKVQKFLRKSLDEEAMPPIKPLLLFTNKDVNLTLNDPAVPVVQTNSIKTHLRDQGKQRAISAEQRKQLSDVLGGDK
ncbi:MAG: NERD domain-containing protein [Anaerolineae bacterium]|nr:NERD domain-containing protein [Anaerolineae bacterium]